MSMNKVLILIVTYNGIEWIRTCLNSVCTLGYDIMVVDNASTDGTIEIIKELYPNVILNVEQENRGFGQANNIGLRYALQHQYEYVVLLNQDACLLPDTIDKMIDAYVKNPEFWILSPVQMNSVLKTIEPQFSKYLMKNKVNVSVRKVQQVDFVNAAIWLLPIQTLKKTGGFDPIFPHYGEDNDYVRRTHYFGGKIGVFTDAIAYHERIVKNTVQIDVYKTKLVFLGILKDVNYSYAVNICRCLAILIRKSIRCILVRRVSEMKLYINALHSVCERKQEIVNHRILSKQEGAFL